MRPLRIAVTAALAVVPVVVTAAPAVGQTIDSAYKGSVLAPLIARRDSTFRYAAYIPRRYTGSAPAPLLLVLDPQGRAQSSIELMVPAAERLGWLVMSSYDTRSDAGSAHNEKAVNLMLDDAFAAFRIDTSRIYLAGVSGTARDTWVFAYGAGGHVAGIISAGASMPGDSAWRRKYGGKPPFDVALAAGDSGFNYDEVMRAADTLRALGAPIRADEFRAGNDWPPEPALAQAMGWLEARAMARKLRPIDSLLVDSVYAVDSARAVATADSGRAGDAAGRWAGIVAAWEGVHDLSGARAQLAALDASPAVRRWRAERDSLRRSTREVQSAMGTTLLALRKHPGVPDLRRLAGDLRIVEFQQWAADGRDSVRAIWSARRLAELYAQVSFYEPEAYISVNDSPRALAMLSVAEMIRPRSPGVCRERARAYAIGRDAEGTLDELRCALAGRAITIEEIERDPRYQFLRSLDAYADLIDKGGD